MTKNLFTRIVEAHNKFVANGNTPDSLFLGQDGAKKIEIVDSTFMGMKVFVSKQYYGDSFRIYCKYVERGVEKIA